MTKQLKARAFTFVCQNNFDDCFEYLKTLNYSYLLIGGYEQGETQTGEDKKHCHCYVDMGKTCGLTRIQKKLSQYGHFVIMTHHDSDYAVEYCKKLEKIVGDKSIRVKEAFNDQEIIFEDGVYEFISFGQGSRTDLKKKLDQFQTLNEFILNEPELNAKYRGGIKDYYRVKNAMSDVLNTLDYMDGTKKIFVEYHTGDSNAGKTYSAAKIAKQYIAEGKHVVILNFDDNGFGHLIGPEDSEIVIINEFRDTSLKFDHFLKITEGSEPINTKGGDVLLKNMSKIIFTSVIPPENLYSREYHATEQVQKRINRIVEHSLIYGKHFQEEREFGQDIEAVV